MSIRAKVFRTGGGKANQILQTNNIERIFPTFHHVLLAGTEIPREMASSCPGWAGIQTLNSSFPMG